MKNNIIFLVALVACQSKAPKVETEAERQFKDAYVKRTTDSLMKGNFLADTLKSKHSPVQVISAEIVQEDGSSYRDIRIKYKNVTEKKISAIRFRWYGMNAFGEPANMGISNGIGSGFMDHDLPGGVSSSATWSAVSRDAKKAIAWVSEVAFEDGTKWDIDTQQ